MGLITFLAGKASLVNISMNLSNFELKALGGPNEGSKMIWTLYLNMSLALGNKVSVDKVNEEIQKGIAHFHREKNTNMVRKMWGYVSTHWVKGEEEATVAAKEFEQAFFEAYGVSFDNFPIPPLVSKQMDLISKSK